MPRGTSSLQTSATGPASYTRIDDEEPQAPHRTKHRPDGLFIHPNNSNIVRAEAQAAALELGVSRSHRGKAECSGSS